MKEHSFLSHDRFLLATFSTNCGGGMTVSKLPNRFQKQCVSDTSASYRRLPEGVEVTNRCRTADGQIDHIAANSELAEFLNKAHGALRSWLARTQAVCWAG